LSRALVGSLLIHGPFRSAPIAQFRATYPLPSEQPSWHSSSYPLISPRPLYADPPFLSEPDQPFRGSHARKCLLADDGCQRNFFFEGDGLPLGGNWRKVNVQLPMPLDTERQRANMPQPEMDGPFGKVKHSLKIRMVCYNLKTEERVSGVSRLTHSQPPAPSPQPHRVDTLTPPSK
jgi:hypothetical protein